MARTLIRNKWNECQTLPAPFNAVLGPSSAILVPKTEAEVLAFLLPAYGSISEIASRLEIRQGAATEAPSGPTGAGRSVIFVGARAQGNVNLASPGATFDTSVTATNGMLILCDQQSTPAQDGIYIWLGATTPMVRAGDLPAGSKAAGMLVAVEAGTADADKLFLCTTNSSADVVGTNGLTFSAISASNTLTSPTLTTPAINGTVTNPGAALVLPSFGMAGADITNAGALNCDAVQARVSDVSVRPGPVGTGRLQNGQGLARFSWNATGVSFFGATPQAQSAAISNAAGGGTQDTEARAAINALLAYLRLRGDIAT